MDAGITGATIGATDACDGGVAKGEAPKEAAGDGIEPNVECLAGTEGAEGLKAGTAAGAGAAYEGAECGAIGTDGAAGGRNPDGSMYGTGRGSVLAMPSCECAAGGSVGIAGGGGNAPEPDERVPRSTGESDPESDAVRRAAAATALPVVRTDGEVTAGRGPTIDPLDGGNMGDDEPGARGGAGVDILRSTSFRGCCGGRPESELDIVVCPEKLQATCVFAFPPFGFFLHNRCATQGRR